MKLQINRMEYYMTGLYRYRYLNINKFFESFLLLLGFFISLLNGSFLSIWTLLMFTRCIIIGEIGFIELFIMIQLRSIINPGIAVVYSGTSSIIKMASIILSSTYILLSRNNYKNSLNKVYLSFIVFSIYVIMSGFLSSSYPMVAGFKLVYYVIPFLAVLKSIYTLDDMDIISRIVKPLGLMIFLSIFLLKHPVGYLRNGVAFQGIFNHPNIFGVMLALYLSGFLYTSYKLQLKQIIVSSVIVILAILSGSRTGIFSCLATLILFMLSKNAFKNSNALIKLLLMLIMIFVLILYRDSIIDLFNSIIFKGGYDSIFYSRTNQFASNIDRFFSSPLIGTGFNVPYNPYIHTYSFSFDMVVENGNLILALLADIGFIGFILFIKCYTELLKLGWGNKIILFLIPFLVSMGEQSFFSTNNFAIIMYIYISIYVVDGLRMKNNL